MSPYQFWIDIAKLIASPRSFISGLTEVMAAWLFSRDWRILVYGLPLVLIGIYATSCFVYVERSGQKLLPNYWQVIEAEHENSTLIKLEKDSKSADAESPSQHKSAAQLDPPLSNSLMSQEKVSPFVNRLLHKVLQLETSDIRATYLVATVLGSQGRLSQARQMMRRIAPEDERGFAPAHSWLAADRIQSQGVRNEREFVVLLNDLAEARRWPGVAPMLLGAYADLLLKRDRVDEAIEVLKQGGKVDSRLLVKLASLAKSKNQLPLFEQIKSEMIPPRQERIERGLANEVDFVELASLQLLDDQIDAAMLLAANGLQRFGSNAQLKRLLSSAYMVSFERSSKNGDGGSLKLELLDLAMKSDPSNPAVLEKIAELTAMGKVTDERIAKFLRDQLSAGKATAITHLLLAVGLLRRDEMEKAIVHLEVAIGLAPNNPIILNNLAVCIARTRPEELAKARKMIEVGLSITGANAELLDSYGEILLISKDYVGAIRAFEAALTINQERPQTRQKLAEAYTKVALDDMAESVNKGGLLPTNALPPGIIKSDEILKKP